MKRMLVFTICFISFIQIIEAQNYIHEFGRYSGEEFRLQRYDKDSLAEAVVIYDIGESYFIHDDNKGFQVIFERKMKIKIFSKAGLKWAQISIPYYEERNEYEKILELKGNTYNYENGLVRISALDPKNVFNEKYNEHWYNRKFAMPDVKEGSIIEISYKIESPYLFNFRNWEFQHKIPVIYSEYTVKMIPFYEYANILQGANKFDDFKSYETASTSNLGTLRYKDLAYNYVMKDLPAFKDESFITSINDYIIKLDFQLCVLHRPDGSKQAIMATWPKLSEGMIEHESFGKYLNSSKKKSKEITDTLQIALKSTLEKAKCIEHFVKSTFNWNGYCDKYASKNVKEFLTSKTGNCADINLFLTGMLNAAGIEAYPVIMSTRSHGKIKIDYPFLHFFNYVMVFVKADSLSFLLDATEPLSNFNEIPCQCINDYGLVIQKDKVEWVDTKRSFVSAVEYNIDSRPNADMDTFCQSIRFITTGYEAIDYRNQFSSSYKELKNKLIGNNSSQGDSLQPKNQFQIEKPFEIDFNKKIPMDKVEDKIIISPFANFVLTENPLKQPVRNYPVDFIYRKAYKFQSTIAIPAGYKLLSKPEDMRVNSDMVRIVFATILQLKDSITVIGYYEFKKDIYAISDYAELKNNFNKIVDKFNEKMVFVKEF